jgi:hypothetical protein
MLLNELKGNVDVIFGNLNVQILHGSGFFENV